MGKTSILPTLNGHVSEIRYLLLPAGSQPPKVEELPFRVAVIVRSPVSDAWRNLVSRWLVDNGCLYMSAWGDECSKWDDSVDNANLDDFAFGDIPDDRFVYTTWHENESLTEALFFSLYCARHPAVELKSTLLIDISDVGHETDVLKLCNELALEYGPLED